MLWCPWPDRWRPVRCYHPSKPSIAARAFSVSRGSADSPNKWGICPIIFLDVEAVRVVRQRKRRLPARVRVCIGLDAAVVPERRDLDARLQRTRPVTPGHDHRRVHGRAYRHRVARRLAPVRTFSRRRLSPAQPARRAQQCETEIRSPLRSVRARSFPPKDGSLRREMRELHLCARFWQRRGNFFARPAGYVDLASTTETLRSS